MPGHDASSILTLSRSVMDDARELVREELALARAELREEASAVQTVGTAFGAAALLALIGVVLLCIAIGGGLAALFDVSAWIGYGIVALLLLGGAFFFVSRGRTRLANIRALPKTRESLQENIQWIRSKSSSR